MKIPQIEKVMKDYIREYVTCNTCKSPQTELARDSSTRLWKMSCRNCGADRSCATIRAGFLAQKKGARKRDRIAADKQQITG